MSELIDAKKLTALEEILTADNKQNPPWRGINNVFFPLDLLFTNALRPYKSFLSINRPPLSDAICLEQETALDIGVFFAVANLGITIGQLFVFPPNAKIVSTPYAVGASLHDRDCDMDLFWRNTYLSIITGPGRVIAITHRFHHLSGAYINEMIATRKSSKD